MAITLAAGSATSQLNSTVSSYTMDVNAGSGNDRLLVVTILQRSNPLRAITAVTFNSVAMTHVVTQDELSQTTDLQAAMYYLIAPPTGTSTLSVTFDGNIGSADTHAVVFNGTAQTTPLDVFNSNSATADAAPAVSLTPTTNDQVLVASVIHEYHLALTAGSGETELISNDRGAWVTHTEYAVQTTATTQSMNWSAGGALNYAAVAASFEASGGSLPTIALNTADASTLSTTPTLEFTGTDADSDDIRYQIQISDNALFEGGVNLRDNLATGGGLSIHPNPLAGTTWLGDQQVDDRPGQSFTATGGLLDKISLSLDNDQGDPSFPDGDIYVRVYTHSGVYGTSSSPLNAHSAANTPTSGWLAISNPYVATSGFPVGAAWYDFPFSGANRIPLHPGEYYVGIADWIPNTSDMTNTLAFRGDSSGGTAHDGNLYIDGASAPNNGPQATWDLFFRVYEDSTLIDKVSGTDGGFVGTPDNTDPYTSGQQVTYTVQAGDTLREGALYYWRVRGLDPSGNNAWGAWTTARTFTTTTTSYVVNDTSHAHTVDNVTLTQTHSLTVSDTAHTHTADNTTLTQTHVLTVAESNHSHLADNTVLTQTHALATQNSTHSHVVDNVALTQAHILVTQDSAHNQTVDNVVLTQTHVLVVNESTHGHSVDSLVLTQQNILSVGDSTHSQTVDSVNLTQLHTLTAQDSAHSLVSDNVVVTQTHALVTNDSLHAHNVDNIVLNQAQVLVVADSTHAHVVDSVTLSQVHTLVTQDTLHAHSVDATTLTQTHNLVVADSSHAHTVDNTILTQVHVISINESNHSHVVDNVTLTTEYSLTLADSTHSHLVDNVVLTQVHTLVAQEATHSHSVDNIELAIEGDLVVQQSTHNHLSDNVALTQLHVLVVNDATHSHAVENVTLAVTSLLNVADTTHAHTTDNAVLTQGHVLSVAESTHQHSTDSVTLTQLHVLTVAETLHSVSSDTPTFTEEATLVVADALHNHSTENVVLETFLSIQVQDSLHAVTVDSVLVTQLHNLFINDALHILRADNITISLPGVRTSKRIRVVEAENRYLTVTRNSRYPDVATRDKIRQVT